MKKIYVLLMFVLLIVSVSYAMGSAPKSGIKTGDKALDKALREINKRAGQPGGKKEIEGVLRNKYSVTQREINSLRKKGYRLNEIYYLSLLAKQSGKKVNTVAALHAKGAGWGVMAKKVGVRAGDMNRLRIRLHKMKKEAVREKKKEQQRIKVRTPKAPRAKPMRGGGGRGR